MRQIKIPAGRCAGLKPGVLFVGLVKGFQLTLQFLDVEIRLSPAHGQAVADEELEEIVQQVGNFAGKELEVLAGRIFSLALVLSKLALDEIVNELGAVHLAPVLVYHLDDVFLDHHNQVVFVQEQGPSHRFISKLAADVSGGSLYYYTKSIIGA